MTVESASFTLGAIIGEKGLESKGWDSSFARGPDSAELCSRCLGMVLMKATQSAVLCLSRCIS